jgi:hypothetical protein
MHADSPRQQQARMQCPTCRAELDLVTFVGYRRFTMPIRKSSDHMRRGARKWHVPMPSVRDGSTAGRQDGDQWRKL